MKFALLGYGTEGDTRPLAFLARALIDAGHEAIQLADASTLGTAKALDVPAVALAGDIRGTLAPEQAISGVLKEASGVTRTTRALAHIANANATSWLQTAVEAGRGCDALIVSGLAAFVGFSAAEFLRIPAIGAGMIPITPTREFPSPFIPPRRVPRFFNRASQALVNQMLWRAFRAETNRARAAVGLPPRRSLWQGHPMLYGISPSLCPTPADWPDNAVMCGQWTRPVDQWTAPTALQAFLDAGEPPLYIGFGSMLGFDNAALRQTIIDAVGDRRTVFQPGWSGIDTDALPANFHVIGDIPHDWLFPRGGAVGGGAVRRRPVLLGGSLAARRDLADATARTLARRCPPRRGDRRRRAAGDPGTGENRRPAHARGRRVGNRGGAHRDADALTFRHPFRDQAFLTNSDFSFIGPKPSILQSMLWSSSTRRILRTLVPALSALPAPLTLRSLTTVTESPSASTLPTASLCTGCASSADAVPGSHSWAHSGQTSSAPSR